MEQRRPFRFVTLLVTFFFLFVAATVARLFRGEGEENLLGRFLVLAVFSSLLVSAAVAVSASPRTRIVSRCLAGATIALFVVHSLVESRAVYLTAQLVTVVFLTWTTVLILRSLFNPTVVDAETICASLCAYLLLGLLWAVLYSVVDSIEAHSFRLASPDDSMRIGGSESTNPLYFSYVTLTTLGYGDIVPQSHTARMLAIVEAMVGQLLLVVLVARLVGLNVAQAAAPTNGGRGSGS